MRYAAFLYNEYDLPILVTGGNPGGGEAEGWVMKRALESLFNVSVHWLETKSMNTAEHAGFTVIPAPTAFHNVEAKGVINFIPQANSLGLSNLALKEWVGRLWYWVRH